MNMKNSMAKSACRVMERTHHIVQWLMSPFNAVAASVNVLALCGVRRASPGGGNRVHAFRKLGSCKFQ